MDASSCWTLARADAESERPAWRLISFQAYPDLETCPQKHVHDLAATIVIRALRDIATLYGVHLCREIIRATREQEPNDQSEQPEHRAEDLDNEDLDETVSQSVKVPQVRVHEQDSQRRIGSISQCSRTPIDPNRDAADKITHPDEHARPKQREPSIIVAAVVYRVLRHRRDLCAEDNGHDDAVDGDDLAEDDGDEVLGSYPRCFDATSHDRRAGYENAPWRTVSAFWC